MLFQRAYEGTYVPPPLIQSTPPYSVCYENNISGRLVISVAYISTWGDVREDIEVDVE